MQFATAGEIALQAGQMRKTIRLALCQNEVPMSSKSNKPIILVGRVEGDPADLPEGIVYHPGRDPDASRRVSKEVEVIDDAQLIAWTRRAYKADVDHRFQVALEQVRSGDWVYAEFLDVLEQCGAGS
jgi:hypothetical protein